MHIKRKLTHFTLLLTAVFSTLIISTAALAQSDAQRKLFKTLYNLALQGQEQAVNQQRQSLDNYPLSHYLDYALLRSQMANLPEQAIADFKQKHPDSPLNNQLKKKNGQLTLNTTMDLIKVIANAGICERASIKHKLKD